MNEDTQYKITYALAMTVFVLAILILIPLVIHVWAKALS
jgi:hypothetical protein